jgi:3-hydroxyisobutyrate dehydrogenase-like beta-hydroxyacid dehydrogenase
MCANLVEKGNLSSPLIIFNRTVERAKDLSAKLGSGKSTVASSVEDAVSKADIILTCLGDDKAINQTIETALKGNVKGKLFVDCSTVHPDTTNALAKAIHENGAEFVAMPGTVHYYHTHRSYTNMWQCLAHQQWQIPAS